MSMRLSLRSFPPLFEIIQKLPGLLSCSGGKDYFYGEETNQSAVSSLLYVALLFFLRVRYRYSATFLLIESCSATI